ncbi:MAG: neutral/alkaline non-lysosomal ceramidase N-terminal domain-containing protein [Spirochaetaceae bacterium]|nr:MAG: neutral/alkaline non-lysosomal ceramidase N-terminal domain-containing protein [Spirochaetaceae bacterium]
MSFRVGFATVDITPPIGTKKAGWLKFDTTSISDTILDPLYARAAVLQANSGQIAFITLDILSIRWTQVNNIRKRIEEVTEFPGSNILIAATHNHAGPATANLGDARRDESYLQTLEDGAVDAFQKAIKNMQEAEIGFGHTFEWNIAYNRRVVMRDGTVRMKGTFTDLNSLYLEGPIDPEVAIIAFRSLTGEKMGVIVNFACHPIHHGGDTVISSGFPGALAREMKRRGWPQTLFLNGANGNLSHGDPTGVNEAKNQEEASRALAEDAERVIAVLEYVEDPVLCSVSTTVKLPFRKITEAELKGTTFGAQRAVEHEDTSMYERDIPITVKKIKKRKFNLAEIQAFLIDQLAIVAIPAEFFVENGLIIKERTYPLHTLIASPANGMVGYVPHKDAFIRGGYETTFSGWSRLAPTAADLIIDEAINLLRKFKN